MARISKSNWWSHSTVFDAIESPWCFAIKLWSGVLWRNDVLCGEGVRERENARKREREGEREIKSLREKKENESKAKENEKNEGKKERRKKRGRE